MYVDVYGDSFVYPEKTDSWRKQYKW